MRRAVDREEQRQQAAKPGTGRKQMQRFRYDQACRRCHRSRPDGREWAARQGPRPPIRSGLRSPRATAAAIRQSTAPGAAVANARTASAKLRSARHEVSYATLSALAIAALCIMSQAIRRSGRPVHCEREAPQQTAHLLHHRRHRGREQQSARTATQVPSHVRRAAGTWRCRSRSCAGALIDTDGAPLFLVSRASGNPWAGYALRRLGFPLARE